MLGSGQKAEQFLQRLQRFAAKTPFEFPELIKASQRLLAFGFAAEQVIPTLTAVGDSVAGMGGDPQALEATIRAIGQVQAKGRLMAEEMMQLNEAGTFSWRALADEIGTSVPKAMELVSKGAVTADIFLAAFQRSADRRFEGMMDKQSRTWGGLISTIKDNFAIISGRIMEPLFDLMTRGMQDLVDDEDRMREIGERLHAVMAGRVVPAIESIVETVRANWPEIKRFLSDTWQAGKDVAVVLGEVATGADTVAKKVGGWDNAFKLIIAGTIATKLAGILGVAGLAGKGTGLLGIERVLRRIKAIGPITIPIAFLFFRHDIEEGIASLQRKLKIRTLDDLDRILEEKRGTTAGGGTFRGGEFGGVVGALTGGTGRAEPLPSSFQSTHATSGLPGYPAVDVFRAAGTPVGAPEDGVVVRVDRSNENVRSGQVYGAKLYFQGKSGAVYFITHIYRPARRGARLKKGDILGYVSPWSGGAPHVHIGKNTSGTVVVGASVPGGDGGEPPPIPGIDDPGAKDTGPAPADPDERRRAGSGLTAIAQSLIRMRGVLSDRVQQQIRARVTAIREDLAKVVTDQQMSKITSRVDKLKTDLADRIKNAMDALRAAVEDRRDVVTSALGRVMDKMLATFDARTDRLLANVRVRLFGVDLGAGEETPAMRRLREFREKRASDDRARQRADELAAAETDAERAAILARHALEDEEARLEQEAALEEQQLADAVERERERITQERELMRERFEARLDAIRQGFADEKLTAEEAQKQILAVMAEYGVAWEDAGALLGGAFATGFRDAIGDFTKAVEEFLTAVARLNTASGVGAGTATVASPRGGGSIRIVPMQHGGRVPGRYVGREDTVPLLATPGETVLDRRLTDALEAAFLGRQGGGLAVHVAFNGPVLGADDRKVARELAGAIRTEFERQIRLPLPRA